jgi:Zn-dependent protease
LNAQLPLRSASLSLKEPLICAATTVIFIAVYAWKYGWGYAVGLAGLIVAHEAGHYCAARLRGLEVSLPVLVPFIGAWVRLRDEPRNIETHAYVAVAGPITGSLAALGCLYLGRAWDSPMLLSLADIGLLLNLLNLVPLLPFDGYHIMGAVSPSLRGAGLPLLLLLFWRFPEPLVILVMILAVIELFVAEEETPSARYFVRPSHRAAYAVVYLLLAGSLALLYSQLHSELTSVAIQDTDSQPDDNSADSDDDDGVGYQKIHRG